MNLLLRFLSALILLPALLWVFYVGGWVLSTLLMVMFGLCAAEYWRMSRSVKSGMTHLGYIYITVGIASLYFLREKGGFAAIILVFAATWSNDTFAYFAGKAFGKHKLCPSISPGKTWEGFVGGALGSLLVPFLLQGFLVPLGLADILWVSIPCMILAPAGDLIESKMKRVYGVKDSGNILPGHGGVLDRIDALLLTGPWALAYFAV